MSDFNFDTFSTPNQFQYSAINFSELGASEYTLVNALFDQTGSVRHFQNELESCMSTIIDSCKKHPRSQNILMRTATFNSSYSQPQTINELHGFSIINNIDKNTLKLNPNGGTPLLDAILDSVETLNSFAKNLNDQNYFVNGILFVVTDGEENDSKIATISKIKAAIVNCVKSEVLESIKMILIGINDTDSTFKKYLENLKNDIGFQYISLGDVTAGKLAKLANWVSQSISSTSQALGTGGPSQNLTI